MLVVDSSILISSFLPDESGPDLEALFDGYDEILAPGLLWAELRNVLLVAERRGRVTDITSDAVMEAVDALGIVIDHALPGPRVTRLARGMADPVERDVAMTDLLAEIDLGLRALALREGAVVDARHGSAAGHAPVRLTATRHWFPAGNLQIDLVSFGFSCSHESVGRLGVGEPAGDG